MGTTTKMAIPYPEATGLVKDGWEDMKDIATQVDAKSGLVLISSTAVSGAVSHSFGSDASPIFTSSFRNYRIIIDNLSTATTNENINFRLRANTTDLTTTVYEFQQLTASSTTLAGSRSTGQTSIRLGSAVATGASYSSTLTLDVTNPQTTVYKSVLSNNFWPETAVGPRLGFFFGQIASAVSHNGFTIFAGTNITATVNIYGYN